MGSFATRELIKTTTPTGKQMGPNQKSFYDTYEAASLASRRGIHPPFFGAISYFLVEAHQMVRLLPELLSMLEPSSQWQLAVFRGIKPLFQCQTRLRGPFTLRQANLCSQPSIGNLISKKP
jgi:hypothetical protein